MMTLPFYSICEFSSPKNKRDHADYLNKTLRNYGTRQLNM